MEGAQPGCCGYGVVILGSVGGKGSRRLIRGGKDSSPFPYIHGLLGSSFPLPLFLSPPWPSSGCRAQPALVPQGCLSVFIFFASCVLAAALQVAMCYLRGSRRCVECSYFRGLMRLLLLRPCLFLAMPSFGGVGAMPLYCGMALRQGAKGGGRDPLQPPFFGDHFLWIFGSATFFSPCRHLAVWSHAVFLRCGAAAESQGWRVGPLATPSFGGPTLSFFPFFPSLYLP